MTTEQKAWLIAAAVWLVGLGLLIILWDNRIFVSETLETILGFVLYFVALFCFLVLFVIKDRVLFWLRSKS